MTNVQAIDMAKSKLECMERQTSSTCPCDDCDNCSLNYEQGNMGEQKEWLQMAVQALEQTIWIPCSEGLPTDNGWYHCTADLDNLLLTIDLYYKNGKWLDNRRINMFNTYEIYGYDNMTEYHKLSYQELISEFEWTEKVIAWMPLLESYVPEMNAGEMESET